MQKKFGSDRNTVCVQDSGGPRERPITYIGPSSGEYCIVFIQHNTALLVASSFAKIADRFYACDAMLARYNAALYRTSIACDFYSATLIVSRWKNRSCHRVGVCLTLSVYLSQVGDLRRWLNLGSQAALRYSHRCWIPAHRMKTGCVNFRQHAPQIGYHSIVPWASRHNRNLWYEADLPLYISWKFGEDQSRHSGGNIGNGRILIKCAQWLK